LLQALNNPLRKKQLRRRFASCFEPFSTSDAFLDAASCLQKTESTRIFAGIGSPKLENVIQITMFDSCRLM